jgi:hypothetical protein
MMVPSPGRMLIRGQGPLQGTLRLRDNRVSSYYTEQPSL